MKFNSASATRRGKTRTKGKAHYVWFWGVFCYGLSMATLITLFDVMFKSWLFGGHTGGFSFVNAVINFVVFPLAGILFGVLMWNTLEAAYQSYLSRQELESFDKLSAKS